MTNIQLPWGAPNFSYEHKAARNAVMQQQDWKSTIMTINKKQTCTVHVSPRKEWVQNIHHEYNDIKIYPMSLELLKTRKNPSKSTSSKNKNHFRKSEETKEKKSWKHINVTNVYQKSCTLLPTSSTFKQSIKKPK